MEYVKQIEIALLGFGNVGHGVWSIINENEELLNNRTGCDIKISKVLVRNKSKYQKFGLPENVLTDNPDDIFLNPDIKIVAELMGGAEPAHEYMLKAMRAKKHVVTANKLVLATTGSELFETAEKEGVLFYYEASVGGGIPIIRELNESLTGNKIEEITGIVNGTTNYILSKMTLEGKSFTEALKTAQDLGYAEADPTSDVEAYDVMYKLSIMASLAFGTKVDLDKILREGITGISTEEIKYAQKFGYKIKLLAIGKEKNGQVELRVHPAMVPEWHPLANVNDSFNAILIKGNAVGDLMLYGRGAGGKETGSAVVGDIVSIIRNGKNTSQLYGIRGNLPYKPIVPEDEISSEYYIRLNIKDKVGVLGRIAAILGKNNVSILSVNQDVIDNGDVSLIFITHMALEKDLRESIEEISRLEFVNKVESILRIIKLNS